MGVRQTRLKDKMNRLRNKRIFHGLGTANGIGGVYHMREAAVEHTQTARILSGHDVIFCIAAYNNELCSSSSWGVFQNFNCITSIKYINE